MVKCEAQIAPLSEQPKVCCVYSYDGNGRPIEGAQRQCIAIDAAGGAGNVTPAECLATVTYYTATDVPVQVPFGEIAECCRDCNPPAVALVVSKSGKLIRKAVGTQIHLTTAANVEPEKCCCGDDCVCKQVPDCEQVRCYPTSDTTVDDKCKGRCVIKTYDENGEEILDDRQLICATKIQCCAEDDTTCGYTCADGVAPPDVDAAGKKTTDPANMWDPMPCTTCGVCCVNNYDTDEQSPTFGQVLNTVGNKNITEAECIATLYNPDDPTTPFGPLGVWHAITDNVNICNPACCQTISRGDEKATACIHSALTECDPCKGRCVEIAYEGNDWLCPRAECKTKQECCGDGNENCEPQCGATQAKYRWETMSCGANGGTNGDKCGTCCKNIYNGDELEVINVECDSDKTTKETCEELVAGGSGLRQYGVWHPFSTCAACNPTPCCREITCPDGKTTTICVNVAKEDCDVCNGRCTELATENQTCAHYRDCCGENGEKCESTCGVAATHSWAASCADSQACGACCRLVYDGPSAAATIIEAACLPDIVRAIDCALNEEDAAELRPDYVIRYSWRPFETCDTVKCAKKKCCGETCPDDVGCVDIDINAACDPCKGRCFEKATGEKSCKTKQECCGADGAECRKCPGDETTPRFEWGGCFENGFKCGVCCVLTKNAAGVAISSECLDDITYEECLALGPNANWKAFETCESAVCIPKLCCNDDCGQAICVAVDKDSGACADFCRGACYAIDADGAQTADSFCATKIDCCGALNENCVPQPGLCPDGGQTIPTYSWPNDCADSETCGVCCKRNLSSGGLLLSLSCDETKTNSTDCGADNYGVWYPFNTCGACETTKQACVETTCRRIINVDGEDEEQIYTHAACRQVQPDKVNCKGVCTEFATAARPYAVTTCKTKSECCGATNAKCSTGCNSATATHSWSQACIDPDKCGACCIVTSIGNGNPVATCVENEGRVACEARNVAGDVGITATWKPFSACRDCSIERCCGVCIDNSIACVDVLPGQTCLQPCNGKCFTLDAAGNLDPTQPATCATKADCCMQGGVNVCRNNCLPGKRWEPTCPENSTKCGVACKTTLATNGTTVLSSICQPGITTYAQYLTAQASLAANESLTWKPWDTCETVICQSKKCCKEKCPGVLGCVDVDSTDPCKQCEGLCYDAVVDPITGIHSIAAGAQPECSMRVDCCGAGNENCAQIPNCPKDDAKIFVPCCDDDVFNSCQCASDPDYEKQRVNTSNRYPKPPVLPYWPAGYSDESYSSRLDGYAPVGFLGPLFQFQMFIDTDTQWPLSGIRGTPTRENPCGFDGPLLPTFNWKDCYPDILQNPAMRPIFVFSQQRYAASSIFPADGSPVPGSGPVGVDLTSSVFQQRFTFYVCQGKKLVDVTDAIMEKLEVRGCKTEELFAVYNRCVFEFITFEGGDYEALGIPRPSQGYEDLSGFGVPGLKFNGFYSFCSTGNCFSAVRIRRYDLVVADMYGAGAGFLPLQSDIYQNRGPVLYTAGSPRPIYQWYMSEAQNPCPQKPPVQPTPPTITVIPDAFNVSRCQAQRYDWADDENNDPPTLFAGVLPVPTNCCRRVKHVFTKNITGGCGDYNWQGPAGTLFNNKSLPDDTALFGCPQNFAENPLP